MHAVSIIGCGYTGRRLARRWRERGASVRGFGSRAVSLGPIAATGAEADVLDLDCAAPWIEADGRIVYYMVPPAPSGRGDERLARLLGHLRGAPRRVVYLSTTGVYGNRDGAEVDEDTAPAPSTERAMRRLAAERILIEWAQANAVSWCTLRVPGIYGPGRLPLARLKEREPAIQPGEATPGNRIHVEDLVSACVAAGLESRADRRIYNVTDGSEDSLTAYLERVARIAGLPPPPHVSRAEAKRLVSPMAWSFLSESRRVRNRRMLQELAVELKFADLDEGIRASLEPSGIDQG